MANTAAALCMHLRVAPCAAVANGTASDIDGRRHPFVTSRYQDSILPSSSAKRASRQNGAWHTAPRSRMGRGFIEGTYVQVHGRCIAEVVRKVGIWYLSDIYDSGHFCRMVRNFLVRPSDAGNLRDRACGTRSCPTPVERCRRATMLAGVHSENATSRRTSGRLDGS